MSPTPTCIAHAFILLSVFVALSSCSLADRGIDGRHSYSLTTFDTKGKLGQVERAMEAAQCGTPIVAICTPDQNGVILASPQLLPSPLALDDGTPRFVCISPEIIVAHSGLAADGRILTAAAQRLALEHEYTFDEDVDISIFLEEMALLFQKYTSLPAARPFGASLLVAFVPSSRRQHQELQRSEPKFYRMDPSGNVDVLEGTVVLMHGGTLERETNLRDQLQHITKTSRSDTNCKTADHEDDCREKVVEALHQALRQQATKRGHHLISSTDWEGADQWTILTASLCCTENNESVFRTTTHEPSVRGL